MRAHPHPSGTFGGKTGGGIQTWPTKILSSRAEWYAGVIIRIRYDKSNHTRSCDKYQYLVFFDDDDSPEDNWFRLDNPDEKWRFNLTQPKECPPLTTWQRLPTAAAAAAAAAAAVAAGGGGGGDAKHAYCKRDVSKHAETKEMASTITNCFTIPLQVQR